MVIYSLTLY